MESYEEIVGFDYTDENEWKNWIGEKFLSLHKQLSIILKLRESLENILKTNLKEAFSQRYIQEILLGGITKEGEYTSNSLAKLYKDALGIYINPKEWVAYCRTGLNPVENGIECKFEDTSFLAFITEMKELVEEVLSGIEIEPQDIEDKEIEEIMNSPEKILEIIKEIYKSVICISANYDYHMFFILNTRCIPRFFIEKAYPKLKENFEKVAQILDLEEKFVPNINDEKIRRNYTLIGHKENGLAYLLFRLNKEIWKTIAEIKTFEHIGIALSDLRKTYYEKVKNSLKKLGWERPEYIRVSDPPGSQRVSGYSGPWYYTYYVEGIMITRYHERGWSARGNYYSGTYECNIPLLQLMNDISPALFLGIYYLRVEGNSIKIIESD